jgi:hypothetical protein
MRGWYPCIPGWHHDDVIRTNGGQPDYTSKIRSEHAMTLINSDIAPTEYAEGRKWFTEPTDGRAFYGAWHPEVEKLVRDGKFTLRRAQDNQLIFFNDRVWHRGVPAVKDGWRWFIRISRYYDKTRRIERGNPRTNETRRQVQVYLSDPNKGW